MRKKLHFQRLQLYPCPIYSRGPQVEAQVAVLLQKPLQTCLSFDTLNMQIKSTSASIPGNQYSSHKRCLVLTMPWWPLFAKAMRQAPLSMSLETPNFVLHTQFMPYLEVRLQNWVHSFHRYWPLLVELHTQRSKLRAGEGSILKLTSRHWDRARWQQSHWFRNQVCSEKRGSRQRSVKGSWLCDLVISLIQNIISDREEARRPSCSISPFCREKCECLMINVQCEFMAPRACPPFLHCPNASESLFLNSWVFALSWCQHPWSKRHCTFCMICMYLSEYKHPAHNLMHQLRLWLTIQSQIKQEQGYSPATVSQ